jgi:hypothetical protein
MTGRLKRKALILLGLAMISSMVIAASLPHLNLLPGMPPPKLENDQVVVPPVGTESYGMISINKLIIGIVLLIAAGGMLYGIYKLIRGANWKEITAYLKPMFVICLIVISILYFILLLPKTEKSVTVEMSIPTAEAPITSPLGPVPPGLFWLVGLGLLVTGVLVGIRIFTSSTKKVTSIDLIGLEAEKAWQELRTGLDLKDVILKCYRQMSLALEKEQGIERKEYMTTREFEKLSESVGVPYPPIHQLTQLFEAVRYGNGQPDPADEELAIHCLETIVVYCRQSGGDAAK